MHAIDTPANSSAGDGSRATGPWWTELNRYHWFVLVVAALGWLFDTMDQQLFVLARPDAIEELIPKGSLEPAQRDALKVAWTGYTTSCFLIGWALGGLIFGVLGDKWGRVRTMLATIIVYSIFTGLSTLSLGVWDFCLWRFLTGLGVGGEFAVGVALVAEVMPSRARPHALGLVQALSAVGNTTAALIGMAGLHWKTMFLIGTAPALLSLLVRRRLKEPERWQAARGLTPTANSGNCAQCQAPLPTGALHCPACQAAIAVQPSSNQEKAAGSYAELFGNPLLRHRAIMGLILACAGVIGLWGIGFFTPDFQREVFKPHFVQQGLSEAQVKANLKWWSGITSLCFNFGAFFGVYLFSHVSHYLGRRPTFALCMIGAMLSTANVFWNLGRVNGLYDVFWMTPLMGFFQLSIFGGYAVYFPELFPTRLRSTGTSFCYNVGRFVAATGPITLTFLKNWFMEAGFGEGAVPFRYAGVTMCTIFLIGLLALPFLPETKDQPLPE